VTVGTERMQSVLSPYQADMATRDWRFVDFFASCSSCMVGSFSSLATSIYLPLDHMRNAHIRVLLTFIRSVEGAQASLANPELVDASIRGADLQPDICSLASRVTC